MTGQRLFATVACATLAWSGRAVGAAGAAAAPAQGPAAESTAAVVLSDEEARVLRAVVIPQAPIDVASLWRYDPETIEDHVRPVFTRAVENLERFPRYVFAAGQVPLYEPLENRAPALWEKVVALAGQGRWEVVGAHYVEFGGAGPCGEALVRQFLHGTRFFREKLGLEVRTAWRLTDGTHPWSLPQILRLCEIDSYVLQRGAPHDTFRWKGIDGSSVLAVAPGRNPSIEAMTALAAERMRARGLVHSAALADGGSPGGGPDAARIAALEDAFAAARLSVRFGTLDAYLGQARTQADALPAVEGELGFMFPGAYTTYGKIKDGNRACENLLLAGERFAAVASRYQPYPEGALRTAWDMLLFNQHHAIIGGRVIPAAGEDALDLYSQVEQIARPILEAALRGLLMHIDTRGFDNPVVVFNPLGWERDGAVFVPAPAEGDHWIVRDAQGRLQRAQVVYDAASRQRNLLFVARGVPSFGYRVFAVIPSPQSVSNPCAARRDRLETPQFQVTLEEGRGDILQITSRQFAWELLAGRGNALEILEDLGDSDGRLELTGRVGTPGPAISVDVIEAGPVRVGVRVRNKLLGEHTTFVREVYLTDGVPWVEFRTHIEWNADGKLVKAAFPLALEAPRAAWEIPFGVVERPDGGGELPALRWVGVGDGRRGVGLFNRGRSGYDVRANTARLSLLRSPTWPARNDDCGNHLVPYALYPHLGCWREGAVVRRAQEYNSPLIAVPVAPRTGALPAQASFFSTDAAHIVIAAVKRAEDGEGLALRLVETEGRAGTARLRSHWFLRGAVATNLLERGEKALPTDGETLALDFRPWEIKTVVLKNWGYAPLR